MYFINDPLTRIKGIGNNLRQKFNQAAIDSLKDLLLFTPLRYEDRSKLLTIDQLQFDELATIQAKVINSSQYYKNHKKILTATIADETGRIKCLWFNQAYLAAKLKKGESYYFSGKINRYHTLVQAIVEDIKATTLHTNRLVPIYSSVLQIKQGSIRRILNEIFNHLSPKDFPDELSQKNQLMPIDEALKQLHFPDHAKQVIKARERLALEELLTLIAKSKQIKKEWQARKNAMAIKIVHPWLTASLPSLSKLIQQTYALPFCLSAAQLKALQEILSDLTKKTPMNRILIGDVGSGKTIVAALASCQAIEQGSNACLIAPTQILAKQHSETIKKIFPQLSINLITGKGEKTITQSKSTSLKSAKSASKPAALYIGTHALLNRLTKIKPALIIYDEQHRFGVLQRSKAVELTPQPHLLTMSATPIPRTYMLTIFSHLDVSILDELPTGQKKIKTWLIPANKKTAAFEWLFKELQQKKSQALIVCPFIDPSNLGALSNVAAATDIYEEIKKQISSSHTGQLLKIALLHSRLKAKEKEAISQKLFAEKIQLLVSTPIVEVGIDLPKAEIMVIEAAERFGLASLHQLRGRVGRTGQQAYCLLFTASKSTASKKRLQLFSQENDGFKLAEMDLKYRGAGDLFGVEQHGFSEFKFASWADIKLIKQAREIDQQITEKKLKWQAFFNLNQTKMTAPSAN